MSKNKTLTTFLILIGALTLSSAASAFVSPKRVMIEDRQSSRAITLFNSSNRPMVYTFEWERRVQLPDGTRKKLKDGETLEGYRPADEMLFYSPRQVVVPPGKFQVVRLLAKRPSNIEEGEYHSHLLIKPEPLAQKRAQEESKSAEDSENNPPKSVGGGMSVRTFMSIPIFVRHGTTNIDFAVRDVTLSKDQKTGRDRLDFVIDNNSTRSFYSKNTLECTKADGTVETINAGADRVYNESVTVPANYVLGVNQPALDQCEGLTLNIGAQSDFEYKANQPIQSVKIR